MTELSEAKQLAIGSSALTTELLDMLVRRGVLSADDVETLVLKAAARAKKETEVQQGISDQS